MTVNPARAAQAMPQSGGQPGANSHRNPGQPLDPALFEGHAVNRSAAERRAATLVTRRSVKKEWQAAWLVNAIRCIDLTAKGRAVVEDCDAMVDGIEDEAFAGLDDLELAMLRRLTFRVFEGQKSHA